MHATGLNATGLSEADLDRTDLGGTDSGGTDPGGTAATVQGQPCPTTADTTADTTAAIALGPEHLDACLALDGLALGGFWSRSQWLTELSAPDRPGTGLRLDGALRALATGWLVLDELHITLVAVDPARRRRGLGRRVLLALLRQARLGGAAHATLEVAASNSAAQALYGSCGFRTAGIRRRYYRDGGDALIQWLNLERLAEPSAAGPGQPPACLPWPATATDTEHQAPSSEGEPAAREGRITEAEYNQKPSIEL